MSESPLISKASEVVGAVLGTLRNLIGHGWWAVARVTIFVLLTIAVVMLAVGVKPQWPFTSDDEASPFQQRPPAEFLYLDSKRALAYLAQMQGGTTTSAQLSHRLTKSVSGKLALKGLLEASGASEEESSTQRVVTPTAASSYVELVNALEINNYLTQVDITCYRCITHLEEGQFVRFRADTMRPPAYVNSYLAVRQNATLSALFPMVSTSKRLREKVIAERAAATKFANQVGTNPRIVFALRPNGEEAPAIQYLLPVRYRELTGERSLIKYGGGDFKVVGKVVRIFPEPGREPQDGEMAYVDSPTRETWQRPLEQAIPQLLCSANPQCLKRINENPKERKRAIDETREELNDGLLIQTRIHRRGAVILPVAIYK